MSNQRLATSWCDALHKISKSVCHPYNQSKSFAFLQKKQGGPWNDMKVPEWSTALPSSCQ